MTTRKAKSKPTSFLDLPYELRQAVFLMSLNDAELHKLYEWKPVPENVHARVLRILDVHTDFRKQAAALRKVDLGLVEDVDFAKGEWIATYDDLIAKWKKVEDCWSDY